MKCRLATVSRCRALGAALCRPGRRGTQRITVRLAALALALRIEALLEGQPLEGFSRPAGD